MTTARSARAGRRFAWPGAVAGSAIALAAVVTGGTAPPAGAVSVRTLHGAGCGKAAGPFSVDGPQVRGADGKVFISYGITVPGLQGPNWQGSVPLDLQKITASADDWCANTVRLQLSQDNLIGPSGIGFDQAYMAAIESEVSLAEGDHLVVVLNDSTEFASAAVRSVQMGPTPGTETFWKDMAAVYGEDPQVIFDLFNEPRTYSAGMSQAQEWQLWLDGGTFGGVFYPFGMAGLAQYVRSTLGARNLFWVEGPDGSVSFSGMVQQHALLKVSGVVYALHHPAGPQDPASWSADFGYLITTGVAPVVDGEWTNYEPAPTVNPTPPRSSCWPDAPSAVPEYLQYLAAFGVGLNVYQLQPGYMIKSYSDLADPTTINPQTWSCLSDAEVQPGQGAGALVLAWFEQRNS
jgi:Cellulase (glycosyl hydrolase family 5)